MPREKDNWSSRAVNVDGKYHDEGSLAGQGRQGAASPHELLGRAATPSSTARRSSACARRTSARSATTAASRRPGRSPTTTWSPTTRRRSALYHVHGTRGEDPTDPPASAPYPHPAVQPRAADPAPRRRLRGSRGCSPFHVPLGIMLDEKDRRSRASASAARPATASPASCSAKADAQVCCVEPALEHPQRHAADRRVGHAPRDRRIGPRGHEGLVERNGVAGEIHGRRGRRLLRRDQLGGAAAALGRATASQRPRQLRRDVVGRHYMGHVNSVLLAISRCPNPTVFQKTLGVNDFYFASKEWELSDGAHLLRRKARRRGALGGRPCDRAGLHARADGEALARLLADVRGPAGSGEPRHARPRGQHRPDATSRTTTRRTSACGRSSKRAAETAEVLDARPRLPPGPLRRGASSSGSGSRWPASPTRTARFASGATRRPRRST